MPEYLSWGDASEAAHRAASGGGGERKQSRGEGSRLNTFYKGRDLSY
jgi:hypothetical protein